MATIIAWLLKNYKTLFGAVLGLSVALLVAWGVILHKQNKRLSERLEMASNNIEAYENIIAGNEQQNNVLQLSIQSLRNSNDSLLHQLDSVSKAHGIKTQHLNTAATQTQTVSVNGGKGVEVDLIEVLKDTTYSDSIQFNEQTKVSYTIGKDTVYVGIDVKNTQYLYIFKKKEYKNKKKFLKRLFTLDFKKIWKNRYEIINTNDLMQTSDVRIVEIVE